ncbi:DUF3833 domain-containing protein [Vibrio europaeus]|uniref:DUF3833 domain-containing protein n=1 Tax=Vibrio europaeus TaxID=300876 RepID=UPI00233F4B8B|nr:DUF3833 domain-containing protein [Vibrio europaeus]MDC5803403.1 DUF3833 domain-containing protein [Vibrio europaeus]MDC5823275.1 DUF3833 domain-containing protein [Vibrio europaeus]MDC5828886.1 DUF3833 domain-containing protein [Vibrio europaeus]MDC5833009.1 DUF3833 domain-containing protein [Vibrio europaeus]
MFKRLGQTILLLLSALLILGCTSDLDDYRDSKPKFNLFEYFEGESMAWGMVQDYTNKQTRRFKVVIVGSVKENTLTLVEDFLFDDGEKSQRIWTIERLGGGRYQGSADDIIGVATGREVGNALQWQYDFELQLEDSTVVVSFDDWLYRQDEKYVFNLTKIKKFGIEVGKITLFFQKQ